MSKKKRQDLAELLEEGRRLREELRQTLERVEARRRARRARFGPPERD